MSCCNNSANPVAQCGQPTRTPTCYPQNNPFSTYAPDADLTPPNPVTPWDYTNQPASLFPAVPAYAAGLYAQWLARNPA